MSTHRLPTVRVLGRTARTGMLVATDDEMPFYWFLTDCCRASAKGVEWGVACRACYGEIDPSFGGLYDAAFDGDILPETEEADPEAELQAADERTLRSAR